MHGIKLRLTFCSGTFDLSIIQVSAKYWEITGNLNAIWFSATFRHIPFGCGSPPAADGQPKVQH